MAASMADQSKNNMWNAMVPVGLRKMFSCQRLAAFAIAAFGFQAHVLPLLDTTLGSDGMVRLGMLAGAEDAPTASTLQTDGKSLIAGYSLGQW